MRASLWPAASGEARSRYGVVPYHGLRYDASGRCVFNPNGISWFRAGRAAYVLIGERLWILWIWPGDPARADADHIPELSYLEDSTHYARVQGFMEVRANYRYIIDNLVDGAHVATVHHDSLASEAFTRAKAQVHVQGDTIWSKSCVAAKPGPIWEDDVESFAWRDPVRWITGPTPDGAGSRDQQETGITPWVSASQVLRH